VTRTALCVVVATAALAVAGCGGSDQPNDVVLVTHDSFAISPAVKKAFEEESGLELKILKAGDAGELVTRALLTAGNPEGDVLFGIDNNLIARAFGGDVFEPYESPELASVDPALVLDPAHRATPIDRGDRLPQLRQGMVRRPEHPTSAHPGRPHPPALPRPARRREPGDVDARARVHARHDRGVRREVAGVLAQASSERRPRRWTAGRTRTTPASPAQRAARGTGPIVVSYASSPPAEVIFGKPRPTTAPTGVVESTCFRQIEFAGVLRGAKNEEGAQKLVDFMLSKRFQEDIPLQMFVFPARRDAAVPPEFEKFAVVPEHPLDLSPRVINENRERWVDRWTDIVVR
jgi:thiamine transport system substrate-binding protein